MKVGVGMRKCIFFLVGVFALLSFTACSADLFGHETYTAVSDYKRISELTEIRYKEDAFELFPKTVDALDVVDFYCEWELGVVGSARVEILLSIHYAQADFEKELSRIQNLGNGSVRYDTVNFKIPAYVSVFGYENTNYYALVDQTNFTMHYVLLQLINDEDIDISKEYLPQNYGELGTVLGDSYTVYG